MAENKGRSTGGMKVDTGLVRELAELLGETGLTEIEVEDGDRKIRVSRGGGVAAAAAPPAPAPAIPAPAAAPAETGGAPAEPVPSAAANANALRSPMVGTVYMSAEPGSDPFVKIGDSVKAGDTVMIVEAMKVMNPIAADRDGTIQEILVENAEPVEFDQPLIVIG